MGIEKNIYIIRHGETDLNRRGVMQGRGMNTDLNDLGKKQAEAFYQMYKDVPFDKIYTSSLKRTHQTVQHFIDAGIPWTQFAGLDELAWGIYEGKQATEELKQVFEKLINSWTAGDLHLKFENGESPLDVSNRQLEVLEKLIERDHAKNILVCMHGRAMRLFLCLLMNLPLHEMDKFPHQNTTLYRLKYDGSQFEIIDFNNTDHLHKYIEQN
mgnify:CR=1 FL=1